MKVLFVEDSKRLQRSVGKGLSKEGYAVDIAGDGEEGLWYAESYDYDVIILDIMLPVVDGLTMLQRLRNQNNKTHILLLTARDTVEDRVRGLKMGADDYLVKPFAFEELHARIEALIRRRYDQKNPHVKAGDLSLDTSKHVVMAKGILLKLQPREYALLEYLILRKGTIISRSEIEEHLYDENKELMSNTLDSCICVLRRKLKDLGMSDVIETVRGQGYRLDDGQS